MSCIADYEMIKVKIIVVFVLLHAGYVEVNSIPADACETGDELWNRMEVLPGIGWDNLRNKEMNLVFEYDYSQCQLTNDRKFLLPDGCYAVPEKQSNVETVSEIIEHWDSHSSVTAASVNVEASYDAFAKISGKFSADYCTTKDVMHKENAFVARAQMRYKLYFIHLHFGSQLNPVFKNRLLDIAFYMMSNNSQIARYLSELLVRDYGTHYITTVHAGGALVKEDCFSKKNLQNDQTAILNIKAGVSADLFDKFKFDASVGFKHESTNLEKYQSDQVNSQVRTVGGLPYVDNMTIHKWVDGLQNNLVAIDREGVPLHFAIRPELLLDIPPTQSLELAQFVEKAINSYYKHNTIPGCTDPDDEKFYFAANIEDQSCGKNLDTFVFGGVFQTCTSDDPTESICSSLVQKNPLIAEYECPPNYVNVLLHRGEKTGFYITEECKRICNDNHKFEGCYKSCRVENHLVTGYYETHWCAANKHDVKEESTLLFGGMYSINTINPVTQTKSCPKNFLPLKFGKDSTICVSDDHSLENSVPFAGFDSCTAGNPLSAMLNITDCLSNIKHPGRKCDPMAWPHKCPTGYTKQLATVEQSCEINYCLNPSKLEGELPVILLPPFHNYPHLSPHTHVATSIVSALGVTYAQDHITHHWKKQP